MQFFLLLPKFIDFVNSDDCNGEVTSKSIRLYLVFIEKDLKLVENRFFFLEKAIKLSYIFLAKQEISEAYTNVPAMTHVNYFISMSVCLSVCLSVVLWHIFVYGCLREL